LAVKCLESYPLRILGRISYGFYIWHLPVLTRTDQYMGRFGLDAAEHWILFGFIGLLLSAVLASISYSAIEKPVLNRVKKIIK
jgi:peptidoglycan/LPS O-acetylase OafA/YrhL